MYEIATQFQLARFAGVVASNHTYTYYKNAKETP